ncbi:FecR protein [Arachidicoccus rhizosphaerae]|uniref:FecR protein n=1 Tax=Arachidicoccus rhizosphaerae TaxID=551991 RepID=A0A1H3VGP0_9BACT|nr:FecR family protein [Arachidicoccus rhizosphaerae]SDZ73831.1 FecR protein [Arachidicoccus rhizosphaerae]
MEPSLDILLQKWLDGRLSKQQAETLLDYSRDPALRTAFDAWMELHYNEQMSAAGFFFSKRQKKDIYAYALGRTPDHPASPSQAPDDLAKPFAFDAEQVQKQVQRRKKSKRLWRALAVITTISCLTFLFYKINRPPASVTADTGHGSSGQDITAPKLTAPTISWGVQGQALHLDQALKEQATRVKRAADGRLVFLKTSALAPPSDITVPKGSRPVHIQLPDSSEVWINTGSTLSFPGDFAPDKRTVRLTGEAYFEVRHKDKQPFEVLQESNSVLVLGTHFNINGYKDNGQTKITLLEGLVEVNHHSYLHPLEQAAIRDGNIQVRRDIDLQEVMAWKNNQFYFNGTSAEEILKQLSRWYNIEIVYKSQIPKGHYSGIISKDNSLSQVLSILETGGIKFELHQKALWIL